MFASQFNVNFTYVNCISKSLAGCIGSDASCKGFLYLYGDKTK